MPTFDVLWSSWSFCKEKFFHVRMWSSQISDPEKPQPHFPIYALFRKWTLPIWLLQFHDSKKQRRDGSSLTLEVVEDQQCIYPWIIVLLCRKFIVSFPPLWLSSNWSIFLQNSFLIFPQPSKQKNLFLKTKTDQRFRTERNLRRG